MKLKLLIAVTILAVIGVIVIAAVKKSEQTPVTPEMTIETQVETEPEVGWDSLGGRDEKGEKGEKEIRQWLTEKRNTSSLSKADSTYYGDLEAVYRSLDSLRRRK